LKTKSALLAARDNNDDDKGARRRVAGSAQLLSNCAALTFVHGEEKRRLAAGSHDERFPSSWVFGFVRPRAHDESNRRFVVATSCYIRLPLNLLVKGTAGSATPASVRALIENCRADIGRGRYQQSPRQMLASRKEFDIIRPLLYGTLDRLAARGSG
jgi:hypothetical protein